jgi:hypothetical protein
MGAFNTGFPLVPTGVVAGTLTFSSAQANNPVNLLSMIQAQLDANFTGQARDVFIQTDSSGALYIGKPNLVGALSTSNYGVQLASGGQSITIYSSFPGANAPVGEISVLMTGQFTFHVFIQPS